MSLPRFLAYATLLALAAILALIVAVTADREATLHQRVADFHFFAVYPNTNMSSNAIRMIELPAGQNTLPECEKLCLKETGCIAATLNTRMMKEKKNAQCWLFAAVDAEKADMRTPGCTLAIRHTEKDLIKALRDKMPAGQP